MVRNRSATTIGEVRDHGVNHLDLVGHQPSRVWLLSTDADTTVAPDWALRHLELARRGAHAVAGVALLSPHAALPAAVARRYSALLAGTRGPDGHGNVYAANLGLRADAYRAVGGFGAVATGEDHDLWRRLRQAGYRRRYAENAQVVTSARRRGRARGGLADLLANLDREAGSLLAQQAICGRRRTASARVASTTRIERRPRTRPPHRSTDHASNARHVVVRPRHPVPARRPTRL